MDLYVVSFIVFILWEGLLFAAENIDSDRCVFMWYVDVLFIAICRLLCLVIASVGNQYKCTKWLWFLIYV